jgi:hypothetical protein
MAESSADKTEYETKIAKRFGLLGVHKRQPDLHRPFAIASAFFGVVISGWRAPDGGLLLSMVWGLIFSASVCTLGYVIGYGIARLVN